MKKLDKITQAQMDELNYCLEYHKKEFPQLLKDYTGIIAQPYTAFQYYSEVEDYIGDSDSCSLENLMEEAEIEVVEVNPERLWYRVRFEAGLCECFKVPRGKQIKTGDVPW